MAWWVTKALYVIITHYSVHFKKQVDHSLQWKAGEEAGVLIILLLLDWDCMAWWATKALNGIITHYSVYFKKKLDHGLQCKAGEIHSWLLNYSSFTWLTAEHGGLQKHYVELSLIIRWLIISSIIVLLISILIVVKWTTEKVNCLKEFGHIYVYRPYDLWRSNSQYQQKKTDSLELFEGLIEDKLINILVLPCDRSSIKATKLKYQELFGKFFSLPIPRFKN